MPCVTPSSWPALPLCWPQHPPFLLWPWCPAEALLLRHIPQWAGHFHSRSGRHCPPTSMHPDLLWMGATILKVPSTKGICKALSTCGSHFSVVSPYYGTILGLYIFPSSSTSRDKITIASVMYTVVTPLLNPFIHSLRNRDMKGALERLLHRAKVLSRCLLIFVTATCVHTNPRAYIATFEPGKKWILSEWPLDCILLQLLFPYNLLV